MSICSSAVLMAALTTSALLSDIAYMRQDRLLTHLILGGLMTALFVGLCQRGYEMVNWGILLIIPVYMLLSSMASSSLPLPDSQSECPVCNELPRNCGCPKKKRPECAPKPKKCGDS